MRCLYSSRDQNECLLSIRSAFESLWGYDLGDDTNAGFDMLLCIRKNRYKSTIVN